MIEQIQAIAFLAGGVGALCTGIAMIIRERYRGKVLVLRAERGDPELPQERGGLLQITKVQP
ncbi:MAG TPA: hypothetical protein VEZ70_03625 [Allosphingosinicella sp.]|nr:hypothetical protein [Allosphingosinicella sp.]